MEWIKEAKIETQKGTTIVYRLAGTDLTVESRKTHIPHANNYPGTWDYTTYWIVKNGKDMTSRGTLKDAKKYAEVYQTFLNNPEEELNNATV